MQPPVAPPGGGLNYGIPAYNPDMPSAPPAGGPPNMSVPPAGGKPDAGFDDLEARLRALQ